MNEKEILQLIHAMLGEHGDYDSLHRALFHFEQEVGGVKIENDAIIMSTNDGKIFRLTIKEDEFYGWA